MMIGASRCIDGQLEVPILTDERSTSPVIMGVTMAVRTAHTIQPTLLIFMLAGTAEVIAVNPSTDRALLGLEDNLAATLRAALELENVVSVRDANDVVFPMKGIAGSQIDPRRANDFDPLAGLRRNFQVTGTRNTRRCRRCYVGMDSTQTDNNGQHG